MDDLKPLAVFAEVVDAGSMSGAARRLGMSPSAVSQIVRALEQQGGVMLLHRSTRKLALTEAGERYYPHCKQLVEAARAAAASLQQARDAPTGELRVSAPVGFAAHIAQALAPLLAAAPQLRLRLLVDDAMIDLIDARIDLAVRVGQLADSRWVARRLCDFEVILCAAPDYLARHGIPALPQDLSAHQWLASGGDTVDNNQTTPPRQARANGSSGAAGADPTALWLNLETAGGERQRVALTTRIVSNNQVALHDLCLHGLGIARLAYADVKPALLRGALVRVLPEYRFGSVPVWAVTPNRDEAEAAKVRAAVEHLRRHFSIPH